MAAVGSITTTVMPRTNVRGRWVEKDIARWKDDAMFVATPPLEAIILLLSDLATRTRGRGRARGRRKMMVIDVKKAHLHAYVDRDIYVDLPPERRQDGKCARLIHNLYGTMGGRPSL